MILNFGALFGTWLDKSPFSVDLFMWGEVSIDMNMARTMPNRKLKQTRKLMINGAEATARAEFPQSIMNYHKEGMTVT
jgi:hypothetical protein